MAAEVLDSGARSLYLDLEPKEGGNYWQGPWSNALRFGEELRRLRPNAWITLAPDVRPWQGPAVPLAEFMSFVDAVAPQAYWGQFSGPSNNRFFGQHGYHVGAEGVTPELIVDVSAGTFKQFGRPIQPIGQSAATPDMVRRFVDASAAKGMAPISLWRYGTSDPGAFAVLKDALRPAPAPPAEAAAPAPSPIVVSGATPAETASSALAVPDPAGQDSPVESASGMQLTSFSPYLIPGAEALVAVGPWRGNPNSTRHEPATAVVEAPVALPRRPDIKRTLDSEQEQE
jgi:hypothetical protein